MRLGSVGTQPKNEGTKNEVVVSWICTYSAYPYGGCNVYADFYSPDGSVSDSDEAADLTIRTTKLEDSAPELFKASICGVRLGDEVSDARNHAHVGCARGWSLGWTDKNGILQSVSLQNPRYHLEPFVP